MGAARTPRCDQARDDLLEEDDPGSHRGRETRPDDHLGRVPGWNDCWFFGTYGTVFHWNGEEEKLCDASPNRSQSCFKGNTPGRWRAKVHWAKRSGGGGRDQRKQAKGVLQTEGGPPPQLALRLRRQTPSRPSRSPHFYAADRRPDDPYRTDLVAVDLDSAGQGWVAGDPVGCAMSGRPNLPPGIRKSPASARTPAPVFPAPAAFEFWSGDRLQGHTGGSLHVHPAPRNHRTTAGRTRCVPVVLDRRHPATEGDALAGGKIWPATNNRLEDNGEPVIARAGCDGTTSVTRFRIRDASSPGGSRPADPLGTVTAIAANAGNDAWASTTSSPEPPASRRTSTD